MTTSHVRVLYDGWSLVYQPNSFEALHLLTILECLPAEIQSILALPGETIHPFPDRFECINFDLGDTGYNRLLWEQRRLPQFASLKDAQLLHLTTLTPPLFTKVPVALSPASQVFVPGSGMPVDRRPSSLDKKGFAERLRYAAGYGGFERLAGLVWPSDLPQPDVRHRVYRLPPVAHPAFLQTSHQAHLSPFSGQAGQFHEDYVLFHGTLGKEELSLLSETWSWVSKVLGEEIVLVMVGLSQTEQGQFEDAAREDNLFKQARLMPSLVTDELAGLYQGCRAVLHLSDSPTWDGTLRNAIASRRPLVALETPIAGAIAGPAAYLVPNQGTSSERGRALGAALITILVEESVTERLVEAAGLRVRDWQTNPFCHQLEAFYRQLLAF
jgi:hypothetical protein